MKTTMDHAGRLVIPKAVRVAAGIESGMPLEVKYNQGRIEIEPVPLEVELKRKGQFTVAFPKQKVRRLSQRDVEEIILRVRNEQGSLT